MKTGLFQGFTNCVEVEERTRNAPTQIFHLWGTDPDELGANEGDHRDQGPYSLFPPLIIFHGVGEAFQPIPCQLFANENTARGDGCQQSSVVDLFISAHSPTSVALEVTKSCLLWYAPDIHETLRWLSKESLLRSIRPFQPR